MASRQKICQVGCCRRRDCVREGKEAVRAFEKSDLLSARSKVSKRQRVRLRSSASWSLHRTKAVVSPCHELAALPASTLEYPADLLVCYGRRVATLEALVSYHSNKHVTAATDLK
jgi:hypothetical protein